MNVGFYYGSFEKNLSGVNRYTKGILENMDNKEVDKYCFGQNYLQVGGITEIHSIYDIKQIQNKHAKEEQYFLCTLADIDVVYSFYYPIRLDDYTGVKSVLTIHDLTPLINLEWHRNNKRLYDLFEIRKSAHMVDKIVAVSESTKKSIIDFYGVSENKIEVVTPAIAADLVNVSQTETDAESIRYKFAIKDDFILSICTFEPRKNMTSLIKAYEMYRDKNKMSNIQLVLTGQLGWDYDNILDMIYGSKYKKDIIITDYVSDCELGILYKEAILFAYISYCEGFGMPILEALNYGKAVLTSNTTSMPEVGGDAVCYCDPYELESVYNSLECLLENDKYRKILQDKAKRQAEKFSYKRSAKKVEEILLELDRR